MAWKPLCSTPRGLCDPAFATSGRCQWLQSRTALISRGFGAITRVGKYRDRVVDSTNRRSPGFLFMIAIHVPPI